MKTTRVEVEKARREVKKYTKAEEKARLVWQRAMDKKDDELAKDREKERVAYRVADTRAYEKAKKRTQARLHKNWLPVRKAFDKYDKAMAERKQAERAYRVSRGGCRDDDPFIKI